MNFFRPSGLCLILSFAFVSQIAVSQTGNETLRIAEFQDPNTNFFRTGGSIAVGDFTQDGIDDLAYTTLDPNVPNGTDIVVVSGADMSEVARITRFHGYTNVRIASGFGSFGGSPQDYLAGTGNLSGQNAAYSVFSPNIGSFTTILTLTSASIRTIEDLSFCDVDGDGLDEAIIVGGNNTHVQVRGINGGAVRQQYTGSFDPEGRGSVACGDVNGDFLNDIIFGDPGYFDNVTALNLGRVRIFDSATGTLIQDIIGDSGANGFGAGVSAADVNWDGIADILVGYPNAWDNPVSPNPQLVGAIFLYDGLTLNLLHRINGPVQSSSLGRSVAILSDGSNALLAAGYEDRGQSGEFRVNFYDPNTGALVDTAADTVVGNSNFGIELQAVEGFWGANSKILIGNPSVNSPSSPRIEIRGLGPSAELGPFCGPTPSTLNVSSIRRNMPVTISGTMPAGIPVQIFGTIFTPPAPLLSQGCLLHTAPASFVLGSTFADGSGNWSITLPTNPLPVGFEVTAQAIAFNGGGSPLVSPAARFLVQP